MMAGKSGRLTFSGRQEYMVTAVYDLNQHQDTIIGYRAYCPCALGYHYLTYDAGALVERTASLMQPAPMFHSYADAQAAIEAWQAHAAHRGESEAE